MPALIDLDGRLTRDPEVIFSNSGTAIAKFSVATNDRIKNKETGQYEDSPPTFWNCVAFGQLAENIAENLSKGQAVIAKGTVKMEKYTTKTGEERTDYPVTIREIGPNLRWAKPKSQASGDYSEPPPFLWKRKPDAH